MFEEERETQFMIKLPVFMKKMFILNNNFLSVYVLEILFPNLKEGKNCKIFLEFWLPPDPQLYLRQTKLLSRFAQIFSNVQYFPIIVNLDFVLLWDRPWYSDESVWILHYTAYLATWVLFNFYIKQKQRFSVWNFTENTPSSPFIKEFCQ